MNWKIKDLTAEIFTSYQGAGTLKAVDDKGLLFRIESNQLYNSS